MQKEIDNLEFIQDVNFDFINSLKKNNTKYLLICDDSRAEICNSTEFEDITATGRHRGYSTIYIKHISFHRSEVGKDGELENTHIVLFKSSSCYIKCALGTSISFR